MKKIYLFICILLTASVVNGQTYFPMLDSISNTWHFTGNIMPVRQQATIATNCDYNGFFGFEANSLFTTGDTLMGAFTYKKITQTAFTWPGFDCNYGYIREDTASRKVYFIDNIFSPEELLYDFSMVPGNTINIDFLQTGGYYQSGNFTLDSIGVIQIAAGTRRLFYLSNHNVPFSPVMQWIEGVGHPGHLIYTKSANFGGGLFSFVCLDQIDRNFYQLLTCFEHDSQKVYFDSCSHAFAINNGCIYYADSCNYWNICGSVEENNSISNTQLVPNPFSGNSSLLLDADRSGTAEINIYGIDGRHLKSEGKISFITGKNTLPIDLHALAAGFFFIEIRSENQSYYLKIIKTGTGDQ